jgi:hypothetical protein
MLSLSAYAEGTRVLVNAEGEQVPAVVTPLRFLEPASTAGGSTLREGGGA